MSEAGALAAKLQSEGDKLFGFMESLQDSQWGIEVYSEGAAWTVRSVLAHLLSADRAFLRLFEQIREGGPGVSEDFDVDRYNAIQQQKSSALEGVELMKRFRAARARMVAFVSTLTDSDLDLHGRHPFLGMVNVREMVRMIYIHSQAHCRDMRRALRGG